MPESTVPALTDLLKDAPTNWGKWGPTTRSAALNYLGPEQVLAAVRLVSDGQGLHPAAAHRRPEGRPGVARPHAGRAHPGPRRVDWDGDDAPAFPGGLHYADDKINAFLQGSTQYDALGPRLVRRQDLERLRRPHHGRRPGQGQRRADRPARRRRARGPARHGPLPRQGHPRQGRDVHPRGPAWTAPRRRASRSRKRDILVIRTNFLQLFFEQGDKFYEGFNEPGLVYSPELVQWFQDMEIPNLVTDTIANEVTTDPNNGVALVLHNALMRNLGVTLTEIADLEKLAADCADDGRYAFLYVAAPLKVAQGSGTPVNPVVIK